MRRWSICKGKHSWLMGLLLFLASFAQGANWYVRPNGTSYGSGMGNNWSNAFSGFAKIPWATINCGDTVWVAGGNYSEELMPEKRCTSAAGLSILRARSDAAEVTSAIGYTASLIGNVHQINGAGISFLKNADYVTISGRTSQAGGQHGWWIDHSTQTQGTGIELINGAVVNFCRFEYMDIQGPGYVNYTSDGRGIDATPISTSTGNVFSHLKIFGWESGIYLVGINNTTFEYMEMFDIGAVNSASYHPNGLYTVGADGLTVRYSRFHTGNTSGIGEGIFCEHSGGCANWLIYGNTFYNLTSKIIQITAVVNNVRIINNTFANSTYVQVQIRSDQGGGCGGSSEVTNNLFFNVGSAAESCGVMSHNLTIDSPNPFVDLAGLNFNITGSIGTNYPRNAGVSRANFFSKDPSGNTYGADGNWDIGAFEYSSGITTPLTLAAPGNLRIQ